MPRSPMSWDPAGGPRIAGHQLVRLERDERAHAWWRKRRRPSNRRGHDRATIACAHAVGEERAGAEGAGASVRGASSWAVSGGVLATWLHGQRWSAALRISCGGEGVVPRGRAGGAEAFVSGEGACGVERGEAAGGGRSKVAFLFTGQGSHYEGMGRELHETQPLFRRTLEQCEEILRP